MASVSFIDGGTSVWLLIEFLRWFCLFLSKGRRINEHKVEKTQVIDANKIDIPRHLYPVSNVFT